MSILLLSFERGLFAASLDGEWKTCPADRSGISIEISSKLCPFSKESLKEISFTLVNSAENWNCIIAVYTYYYPCLFSKAILSILPPLSTPSPSATFIYLIVLAVILRISASMTELTI